MTKGKSLRVKLYVLDILRQKQLRKIHFKFKYVLPTGSIPACIHNVGVNRLFLNQRHFHIFNPFCPPPGSHSRNVLFLTCLHS